MEGYKVMMKTSIFDGIIGMHISSIQVGKSTGSIISIDIGNKSESHYSLMIFCAWRLDDLCSLKPLTGWNESNIIEKRTMAYQIKKLEEDCIVGVITNSYGDLEIHFDSNKVLKIFCDITENISEDCVSENWNFFNYAEGICYSFTNNFELITSKLR